MQLWGKYKIKWMWNRFWWNTQNVRVFQWWWMCGVVFAQGLRRKHSVVFGIMSRKLLKILCWKLSNGKSCTHLSHRTLNPRATTLAHRFRCLYKSSSFVKYVSFIRSQAAENNHHYFSALFSSHCFEFSTHWDSWWSPFESAKLLCNDELQSEVRFLVFFLICTFEVHQNVNSWYTTYMCESF